MLLLNLDKKSKTPLYKQVYNQIVALIQKDVLKPGTKLPSSRLLAENHEVSRITITKAYEYLWSQGYTDSNQGGYTTVRFKPKETAFVGKDDTCKINFTKITKDCCNAEAEEIQLLRTLNRGNKDFIDMSWFDIDERLFPLKEFKRAINNVLYKQGKNIFLYSEFQGYPLLRNFIASRMNIHGMLVSPDEVLITNGSQNGLDLIIQALCKPGSKVIAESPSYLNIFPLLKNKQVEIVEIKIEDEGIDPEELEQLIVTHKPSFFYTMPNFQNPTGISMSQEKREKVLTICQRNNVPIIEDGFDEEMKFMGKLPMPIKAIDKCNIVVYVSSFSKVLSTGMRIGWIACHESLMKKLVYLKRFSDISTNTLIQAALAEFCTLGYFEYQIKRLNRIFKKRMQIALHLLKENINNKNIYWSTPLGGYLIWFKLYNLVIREKELMNFIEKYGINVNPGSRFYINKPEFLCFRLTISKLNEDEIETGIKRLSKALNDIYLQYYVK